MHKDHFTQSFQKLWKNYSFGEQTQSHTKFCKSTQTFEKVLKSMQSNFATFPLY